MNLTIQITQVTLNGSEINSVNLRDLHKQLKSKRQFADYAKGRLGRFIEDEDYVCISQKSEIGNKPLIEYYVTFETAKMIAMMENNEIGDEVRRYFVTVEKHFLQDKPKTELDLIIQSAREMQKITQKQDEQQKRIELLEDSQVINTRQKYSLKKSVQLKVYELKENHNLDDSFTKKNFQRIWKKLKDKYLVNNYSEIPFIKFDEAIEIIKNVSLGDLI